MRGTNNSNYLKQFREEKEQNLKSKPLFLI